jgi:hypothetical protein
LPKEEGAWQQLGTTTTGARSGRLFFEGEIMGLFWTIGTTTRAAKRPPSGIGQQLGTTTMGANEEAAFLNWATIGNNNYGREAVFFLQAK